MSILDTLRNMPPSQGATMSAEDLERLKRGLPLTPKDTSMHTLPNATNEPIPEGMNMATPMSYGGSNLPGAQYPGLDNIGGPAATMPQHGMMAQHPMQAPQPQQPQQQGLMTGNPPIQNPYGGSALPGTQVPGATKMQSGYDQALEEAHLKEIFEQEASDKRVATGMPYRDRGLSALKDYKDMSGYANIPSLMNMVQGVKGGQEKFENFMPAITPMQGLMGGQ